MGEENLTESAGPAAEIALPGFVIPADEAERMAAEVGVQSVEELLPLLVPSTMRRARAPISRFMVGAVGLGASGRVYAGVNMEFPGLPLAHSVHAEQCLVANAAGAGESAIRSIAVSHMPCGHCRQFLQEVRGAADIRILVTSDGPAAAFGPLANLLPRPFGPQDLLPKDMPLLLEPHENHLGDLVTATCNGVTDLEFRLKEAATAAARAAHAPYSGCAAGFAVADEAGNVYAGMYVESAAYNPSLGPMQAAMIAMVAGGGGEMEVTAAALVEQEKAVVKHEGTARIFLDAVAPTVHLRVYHYRPSD